jgi:Polymerase beta, Nucleotidyltransferase
MYDISNMRFHNELDELLGSPIRVRVLRVLTRSPDRGFTGRELARICDSSPSQTNAALDVLQDSGVAYCEVAGHSHVWRLVPGHILRELLRQVFQGEADSFKILKADIENLLRPLPVKRAFLFGSTVRGDERVSSDVDLLVQVESKSDKEIVEDALSRASGQFALRFGNSLSPLVQDRAETRRPANPQLMARIFNEGVELGR